MPWTGIVFEPLTSDKYKTEGEMEGLVLTRLYF